MFGFKKQKEPFAIPESDDIEVESQQEALEIDTDLSKVHDFNTAEKIINAGKLAQYNLGLVVNFFKSKKTDDFSNINNSADSEQNEAQITILKELDPRAGEFMESDIQAYYRDTHKKSILQYLQQKNYPKKLLDTQAEKILKKTAKKRIDAFKEEVKKNVEKKLKEQHKKEHILIDDVMTQFWQWRLTNPPNSKPFLVSKNNKELIQYDNFTSEEAIDKFISHYKPNNTDELFFKTDDIKRAFEEMIKEFEN